jgi:hypothetical protein
MAGPAQGSERLKVEPADTVGSDITIVDTLVGLVVHRLVLSCCTSGFAAQFGGLSDSLLPSSWRAHKTDYCSTSGCRPFRFASSLWETKNRQYKSHRHEDLKKHVKKIKSQASVPNKIVCAHIHAIKLSTLHLRFFIT